MGGLGRGFNPTIFKNYKLFQIFAMSNFKRTLLPGIPGK